jgi:hypothetical protein
VAEQRNTDFESLNSQHPTHTLNITDMASASDVEVKYELITRRLQEVLGGDLIKAILAEGRPLKAYWGKCIHPRSNL